MQQSDPSERGANEPCAWADALLFLRRDCGLEFAAIAQRAGGVSTKSVMRWMALLEGRPGGTAPLDMYGRALIAAAQAERARAQQVAAL